MPRNCLEYIPGLRFGWIEYGVKQVDSEVRLREAMIKCSVRVVLTSM